MLPAFCSRQNLKLRKMPRVRVRVTVRVRP